MSDPLKKITNWVSSLSHGGQGNSKGASNLTKRQKQARKSSTVGSDTTAISSAPHWAILVNAAQAKREHLWDEAYDNLRLDLPELVTKYEEILSLDIEAMATESTIQGSSRTELIKTSISQTDLRLRWHQMCRLLSWWLNKRVREWDSRQSYQLQDLLRDHVRKSTSGKLPGALAWVCVCYASQVLLRPPSKTESIRPGLLDIISKMNWYNCLPRLIVGDDTDVLLQEEQILRSRVVDLYKEVLSYLMNAVLPTGCQFDSWELSLARLKEAEDNLLTFSGGLMVQQLDGFLMLARENENRQISPRIMEAMSLRGEIDDKLSRLGGVDAASGLIESHNENGFLADELCQWISSTEQYKSVIDWNTKDIREGDSNENITGSIMSQILLIGSGLGLNKTALMEAIVRQLSNKANVEESDILKDGSKPIPWSLLYYSCGRTGHGIDNSTRVLRGLLHSLLQQQPKLISHLNGALKAAKRDRFDSPKDFFALSGVFFSMLDDKNFVRSYLVIDSIDECSSSHRRDDNNDLGDLIRLIEATRDVPHKIRWLLSADMKVCIELELMKRESFQYISLEEAYQARKLAGIFRRKIISMVDQLAKQKRYPEQTKKEVVKIISDRSQENTVWAVIACASLRKEENWNAVEALKEMPERLDEMYEYVRVNMETLPRQDPKFCKSLLSTMAIVHRPLLVSELVRLAELPSQVDPLAIIEKCLLLEVQSGIVQFIDPTARQNTLGQLHQDSAKFSEAHSLITRKALEFLSIHFETVTLHVPELNCGQDQSKKERLANTYGTLHWITHLLNVKNIAKDAETVNLVVSFMNNHFLLWLDALTSAGLHIDAAVLMKKLESVLLEQARDEKGELMRTRNFKQPMREISDRLGEKDQNHILALIRDGIQIIRSHMSSDSIFSTNPSSVLFYPDESTLKQDWMAKNKTWLVMPPKTAGSWSDISLTLASQNRIRSIAFSPDGRLLASGSRGNYIRVWDAETGEAQLTLSALKMGVYHVAFSPNGQLVSVSENGNFHLWDLSTGRSLKTWTVEGREIMAIRFSPNAEEREKLVLATSKALLLWSFSDFGMQTCKYTEEILDEEDSVYAVDFSQQGTWIASGGTGGCINIWDAHHGNALQRTIHGHKGDVNSVAFSRDEKRLVSGSEDLTVKIWSVETGANLKSFDCAHVIREVAFSPDDSLITAGSGNQVNVWESESGAQRCVMRGHEEPVTAVAFSPEGRLASGSADWTIRLWSLEGSVSNDMSALSEPVRDNPIRCITMSPDGKYLASASGQGIRLWDGLTGMPMKIHELFQDGVMSISFSPDGTRLVTSSRDETVKVWDVASGNIYRTFHGHSDWVTSAIFSPDGTSIASASDDHTVRIWSCLPEAEGKDPIVLQGHSRCVSTLAFSPDGRLLVSGDMSAKMIIWDLKGTEYKVAPHTGRVVDVIFSQDSSKIVSRSGDRKVWVWDSTNGGLIQGPLEAGAPNRTVGFDRNIPEYILTEGGADLSAFESSPFLVEEGQKGGRYGVAPGSDWITWNGEEIIPIPKIYQPTSSWVQGNIVAIGTQLGKVLLFRFSTEAEPPN